jgi:hypothetical protein
LDLYLANSDSFPPLPSDLILITSPLSSPSSFFVLDSHSSYPTIIPNFTH